jgi:hypothetical protein
MISDEKSVLHSLSHTFVLIDISKIGLSNEIYPPEGKPQPVSALRFQNWKNVEEYLLKLGATNDMLDQTSSQLRGTSVAVLTIV